MDDFPMKDVVIESYYWAHPEKFREKNDSRKEAEISAPLNAETRKTIRQIIVSSKAIKIQKEAFERLMQNYHVKITDGKGRAVDEKAS